MRKSKQTKILRRKKNDQLKAEGRTPAQRKRIAKRKEEVRNV